MMPEPSPAVFVSSCYQQQQRYYSFTPQRRYPLPPFFPHLPVLSSTSSSTTNIDQHKKTTGFDDLQCATKISPCEPHSTNDKWCRFGANCWFLRSCQQTSSSSCHQFYPSGSTLADSGDGSTGREGLPIACELFANYGTCPYGDQCIFAHNATTVVASAPPPVEYASVVVDSIASTSSDNHRLPVFREITSRSR